MAPNSKPPNARPGKTSDRSTRRTVLIAGGANIVVAAIKLAAGLAVGSSAMLAEAAHSIADTLNQAFLLASDRAEDLSASIDRRLAERLPVVPHVFLDPTQLTADRTRS